MVKFSNQLYSVLFFITISILTIITVQTIHLFIKNEIGMVKFMISLIIELIFVFVIIKVYDEIGCKWENIKIVPISKKRNEEIQAKIQNNYYYNNITNLTKKFCPHCGISIEKNHTESNLKNEILPRFCRNCGTLLNNTRFTENNQK
jgi:hypothetical protein